jgi:DNA polymerase III subunit delta
MVKVQSTAKKSNEPIYVITGKETSLVNAQCEKLLDELVTPQQRATGLLNADADLITITEVLDELRTLPFLTDKRIVCIKDADDFISNNRQLLENYFDNPSPTGILVLTTGSFPATTKLAKKLSKVGKLINVTTPKACELPDRVIGYAREAHDKTINKITAEFLIELAGDGLSQLYAEIDKLALFVHPQKVITTDHIESLIGHNRLFNTFNVIDASLNGNTAQAIDRLRRMFDADKTAEYTFVGAFAFHFRRMFNAKALLDKGHNPGQVAGELKIWGNKNAFFAQLRKVTLKQIGDNLQYLAEIDYAIKTGQAKPQVAAEQLVFKLASNQ